MAEQKPGKACGSARHVVYAALQIGLFGCGSTGLDKNRHGIFRARRIVLKAALLKILPLAVFPKFFPDLKNPEKSRLYTGRFYFPAKLSPSRTNAFLRLMPRPFRL